MTSPIVHSHVGGGATLPASLDAVPTALVEFRRFCLAHALPDEEWPKIELAVTEGMNNAIEHGAREDAGKSITVRWQWEGQTLDVKIVDPGNFVPREDAVAALPDDPLAERGRGTFLMHRLAGGVIHSLVPGGHQLHLSFPTPAAPERALEAPSMAEETLRMMTEDLSSAYENLSALFRLSESLAASDSLALFLERSMDELFRLVGCDGIHVARYAQDQLEELACRGLVPPGLDSPPKHWSVNLRGRAAHKAVETTVEDPSSLSSSDPLRHATGPLYVCPMALSNRVLGVMVLFLAPGKPYFTAGQLRLTRTFADVVAIAMASDLLQQERAQQQRVVRELEIAAELQKRLLPKSFPSGPPWEAWGVCQSARQAGGDFFDLIALDGERMVATVADVMGKGISAAMVGTIFRTIFHSALDLAANPEAMTTQLAELTYREINDLEVYITAQVVLLDATTATMTLAAAGHCPLLHVTPDGVVTQHAPNGFPLGLFESSGYEQVSLPLGPGDRIILFTDGFPEADTGPDTMLEMDGFIELVRKHRGSTCRDFCRRLMQDMDTITNGREATDDRTLLVIDYHPRPS